MEKVVDINKERRVAWEFVEYTGISVFLTGKAGTGKTTFLHDLVARTRKRVVVVAPTGVAAINAGGVTIHSFFQLPLSPFVPGAELKSKYDFGRDKRKIIASLDLLIIDEISMVRCDLLDAIDYVLRRYRDHHRPFGGVQLLMIGDLAQLTPVVTPEEEGLIKCYYETPYFFSSNALRQIQYVTVELSHVYRQQELQFVELLNHVRTGHLSESDLSLLNSRYKPGFIPKPGEGYIRLTTHNHMASRFNEQELMRLSSRMVEFKAKVEGTFPETSFPTEATLCLKEGAQVMFIKNDTNNGAYYNGLIGCVTELSEDRIVVTPQGSDSLIEVDVVQWENTRYALNEKTREIESEVLGTFSQYPLRLAWSITIHKSQGLTFDRAIVDAGHSFAPGQAYVALSRLHTLDGLVLSEPIPLSAIINDGRVDRYMLGQQDPSAAMMTQLPILKQEYERHLLTELFDMQPIWQAEEGVVRVFSEYLSRKFAPLYQRHLQATERLRLEVVEVARKWEKKIAELAISMIQQEDFRKRVVVAADYFKNKLEEILSDPIRLTKDVKSDNKQAMKLLQSRLPDLRQQWLARRYLLNTIAEKGFDPTTFLKAKQTAMLDALDEGRLSRKRAKKATKAKEPKPKTWDISYDLFVNGLSIGEIAKSRGFTVGTICNHLQRFVASGDIKIKEILPPQLLQIINAAFDLLGDDAPLADVKARIPGDLDWGYLRLVLESRKT